MSECEYKIFYFLDAMTHQKKDLDFNDEEIYKSYDIFMVNRWLSMCEMFIPFVNDNLNKCDMEKQTHYKILKDLLPKQKIYFKYITKKKDLTLKEKKYIAEYFELGLKEAEMYTEHLSEDIVKEILEMYKYGQNKMVAV